MTETATAQVRKQIMVEAPVELASLYEGQIVELGCVPTREPMASAASSIRSWSGSTLA